MGFMLWLDEGYADCLEGHTYDESTVGLNLWQALLPADRL